MERDYRIELLAAHHQREAFQCGVADLDRYLAHQARQDSERRVAAAYVLVSVAQPERIAGFYTLSNATIELTDLPDERRRRLPRYPALPATLLGRLAVASTVQGQGLGALLLVDALRRSELLSRQVGSVAVLVDTKAGAEAFYQHYGFQAFAAHPQRLFLLMATIRQLFA